MAKIVEHGLQWKDTYAGVWTALVAICGVEMIAYAVEVVSCDDAPGWKPIDTEDAAEHFRRFREATDQRDDFDVGSLAGMSVAFYVAP